MRIPAGEDLLHPFSTVAPQCSKVDGVLVSHLSLGLTVDGACSLYLVAKWVGCDCSATSMPDSYSYAFEYFLMLKEIEQR